MLIGWTVESRARTVSYGNDALPSGEVLSFEKTDARLKFRDARIAYDARDCAVYEGMTPSGRVARRPLLDERGKRICFRKR